MHNMDTGDEPQKKVFKARKTMKASDRQQLEALHKAKEDLQKPAELKLVNGSHENGDSDMNFNDRDSLEDKSDLDSININCERQVKVSLSDFKEDLKSLDQVSDLKLPQEPNLSERSDCQDTSKDVTDEEVILASTVDSETLLTESNSALQTNGQNVLEGLALLEESLGEKLLGELSQSSIPVEGGTNVVKDVNHLEDGVEKELESESAHTVLDTHGDLADNEPQVHNSESLYGDSMECDAKVIQENLNEDCQNEVGEKEFPGDEMQGIEESEKINVKEQTPQPVNAQECELACNMDVVGFEETATLDVPSVQQDVGEQAISSSVELYQTAENSEKNSPVMEEVSLGKAVSDLQPDHGLKSLDSMETDEIIPILEKLAPVEDVPQSFAKPDSISENVADENVGDLATSSKNDANTSLPSEAFLVLSDEEEVGEVATPQENESCQDTAKVDTKDSPEAAEEQQKHQETADPETVKGEVSLRKRSKSEDLEGQSSKRRRFEGEEYEAELKVKITAGDDLNKKLQKVIQGLFEEKLSALQCADFDKAIAELKTRVEKIECKKHENVLHSIQAKISRLTKRFGAAKEDLKRRPEQTTVTQSASPGKSSVIDSTPNQVSSTNYRNTGTVRQMLESKRSVGETTTTNYPMSTTVSSSSNLTLRTSNSAQIPVTQSSALQTRAPPDWKLIQQKINAQNTQSAQSKPNTSVTSASVMPSVLTAPTATVVGSNQPSTSSTQPMSVSLQSLPVILHVPVAMSSQSQILQGATGTLVTNQQSGNVEFISVQNQSTVGNLTKTPVTIPVTKAINSPSIPSTSIQRNSPASSITSTLAVQSVPANNPLTISRPPLANVVSSGNYCNRNTTPLKSPGFTSSSESSAGGRTADLQISRAPAAEPVANKRTPESNSQPGKSAAGVIDLTLDDEDPEMSSQDSKRNSAMTSANVQTSQSIGRQSQVPQMNNHQSPAPVGLASQATMHVVPTAQTTVNITQRPGTQPAIRASAPRAPNAGHVVYTTALPTAPVQTPMRSTVMQNQTLRQMTPQTGGVPVRMQQTATYVVNNGIQMGSGPQLTVHHRPPQEATRPIHPAPLPEAPQPQRLPPEATSTSAPQKPHLKLARVQSQNGIVLSWSVLEVDRTCAAVDSYHLYAYHEDPSATSPSQWKKIGEVKALPLPMACTLTQFVSGSKYYFAVRAKDIYGRFGPFCDPQSTDVISTQSS